MLNLKEFEKVIEQISREKGIPQHRVVETIEAAIGAAYKKEYGKKSEIIRAKLDFEKNAITFTQVKNVVDKDSVRIVEEVEELEGEGSKRGRAAKNAAEDIDIQEGEEGEKKPRYNANRHIFLEEARTIRPNAQEDDEIEFLLETKEDFGRIAAQTAKQVIIQKIREAERVSVFEEFKSKEHELMSGIIQSYERGNVYVNLGKATGVVFANESISGERYNSGQRMRFYVLAVQEESRLPGIILSRAHPKFVEKLFELEVPEIADGIIEVKAIAREPGSRTKIAVFSKEESIDPVGSCVGQRGSRVMAVINELGQEKIDIIPWSESPETFVANALSPAKVRRVEIKPRREVLVYVVDDQLSLAIGKGGQNVRLAAKLTGWKIDVRATSEPERVQEGGIAEGMGTAVQETEEGTSKRAKARAAKKELLPAAREEDFGQLGVGPKTAQSLKVAGYTIEKLKTTTKEELVAVEGVGEKTAEKILEKVRNL